jgi:hypothetical protein
MVHLKPKIAESVVFAKELLSVGLGTVLWAIIAISLFFFPVIAVISLFLGRG